ncbi:MAG TPA: VIT and VWA domain-containing protein, partial [Planctomicrobium sp.]|nr:VIT and VWA domain-containing protein [Planctomicrobium sp.]
MRRACFLPASCLRLGVGIAALLLFAVSGHATSLIGGTGDVAIRATDESEWRILYPGESLPKSGSFRTSAAGFVEIRLGNGKLFLDADTHLDAHFEDSLLTLHRGRIFLELSSSEKKWRIQFGEELLSPGNDTTLNLRRSADVTEEPITEMDLLNGTITWTTKEKTEAFEGPVSVTVHNQTATRKSPVGDMTQWSHEVRKWTVPASSQGPGQLLVHDAQSGSVMRMDIARYHVNVVLKPPVALVQIDQSFFNPTHAQREGTFVFNLPPGASVSRFAMFVTHDQLIEGELVERQQAAGIYDSIVRRQRDPAILEQLGDNLFRMRVFPIFGHDTKRILLDFTVPLAEVNRQTFFHLPLMSDLKPIWDLRIQGTIASPVTLHSLRSTSHPDLEFNSTNDGAVRFDWHRQHVHPPSAFEVAFEQPTTTGSRLERFITSSPKDPQIRKQYFLATLPPDDRTNNHKQISPNDVLILVDTSSSAGKLDKARSAVRTIVGNLRKEDRFQLACVDRNLRRLTQQWISPLSAEAVAAMDVLEEQFALGPSKLEIGLADALQLFSKQREHDRQRHLIYIGDGEISRGVSSPDWTRLLQSEPVPGEATSERPVIFSAVAINPSGKEPETLRRGVQRTGGSYFPIEQKGRMGSLLSWVASGLPVARRVDHVEITGANDVELFTSPTWPHEESLYVFGVCRPTAELQLAVTVDGEQRDYLLRPEEERSEGAIFTGRLWAQRKLEQLLSRPLEPTQEQKSEIIALAQEWSLMSPYTAFLVLESEADYARWKIDRRLRHRYWKPAEAVAAIPYPPEVQELIRKQASKTKSGKPVLPPLPVPPSMTRAEFEERLEEIRVLVEQRRAIVASKKLQALRSSSKEWGDNEFRELELRVQSQFKINSILHGLGFERPLFDRHTPVFLPRSDLPPDLLTTGEISRSFLSRHPLARQMMKRIELTAIRPTLTEFAQMIQEQIGFPVLVDEHALREEGTSPNDEIELTGLNHLTLRNLLFHGLSSVSGTECTAIESPHFLRITTVAASKDRMETHVYPVVDLVRTNVLPTPESLSSPYRDIDRAFLNRAETAMDRPVSVNFKFHAVSSVAEWLRQETQLNVRLDRDALEAEGLTGDENVQPLEFKDVPLRVAVNEVFSNVSNVPLILVPEREVIKITTAVDAEEKPRTEVYSTIGIIYELPGG